MHYYQFNIKDFALHTSHLSLEEEAVYRRLLDYYYDTEQPIPKETKWVIRRLRLDNYQETMALILEEFFILGDDGWHNLRADEEIKEYNKKAETARSNGKKGGRPKKAQGVKTQLVSDGMQEKTGSKANHKPLTINQEPITSSNNAHPAKPESPALIQLPTNKTDIYYPVTEDDYRLWSETYPAVNIKQELLKILAWLDANKSKRKTIAGMKRFINNWLSRAQDTGGSRHAASGRNNQQNNINWDSTDWADGIVGDGQGANQQAVRNAENDFPGLAASFQDAKGS